ncbi:MAG: hypothetical protein GY796_22035 [Chloroflexi bacterium]|nr:hypothetical protein [Chloroflexota bacterium]
MFQQHMRLVTPPVCAVSSHKISSVRIKEDRLMKFAEFAGNRVEPSPKSRATCPFCGQAVMAKCGKVRIWHWAHKNTQHCDRWWEPETDWHRKWKDLFPAEWQEIGRRDNNGELHIADVLTSHGMALEFQHSHIKREEVETRTDFHGNICWVVDGLRLENSLKQFNRALDEGLRPRSKGGTVYQLFLSDSRLLKQWSGLNAPIVFDFGGYGVWVIGRSGSHSAYVYQVKRDLLVQQLKLGNRPPPVQPL